MSILSARYGVTVDDLSNWNYISNRDIIYPGHRLIIQRGGGNTAKYHTIVLNQFISHLTALYGIRQSQLCLWNNIRDPDNIYGGQEFRVG